MDVLKNLTKKIHLAADELVSLKKERQQMLTELEWLRQENQKHQLLARENEKFRRDRDKLRSKLEKLNKRIDKLIQGEKALPTAAGEGTNEESA
jgi:seryl-tRNA synthetase